ncbi:MAG: toll/interleukin-1 receptor domain-containing protein, partial [Chitinophagaceae bacterium]
NDSFPKINLKKLIPCRCQECMTSVRPHFYEYSDLIRRIENNKTQVECPISYENIIVRHLIETIFESDIDILRLNRKTTKTRVEKNKVFISYSHQDIEWVNSLKRHFTSLEEKVDFWDDSRIIPGEKWKNEIENAIDRSRVAILMLTADFFNSDFIKTGELPKILEDAEYEGTIVLIVVIKPCLVDNYPKIAQYQFVHRREKTIIEMSEPEREMAWIKLVKEIKKYI